jgi:hypothetical protein
MRRLSGLLLLLVYTAAVLEGFSFLYFRFNLGRLPHAPVYASPKEAAGAIPVFAWYTHFHPWGAWHRADSYVAHINWCYEAYYRSNSDGARDVPRAAAGRDRAVFLGDSFVEGFTVNDADRMTNLLEALYQRPVLNFGAGGHFGPLQSEIIYRELVRRFDHRHVFIGILPDNDFTDNDAEFWRHTAEFRELYRPYYSEDGRTAVYTREPPPAEEAVVQTPLRRALEFARRYTWTFGIAKEVRRVVLERQHRGEASARPYAGYRDPTDAQIDHVLGSLRRIVDMARADGRRVTVVLFPRPNDYALVSAEAKIRAAFDAFAAGARVTLVDLRELVPYDRDLFQACDGHWSPQGNRAAAQAIFGRVPEL